MEIVVKQLGRKTMYAVIVDGEVFAKGLSFEAAMEVANDHDGAKVVAETELV